MKKSIIRFIAVFLVLVIIVAAPAVLSLFAKKKEVISLKPINSTSLEKVETYPSYPTPQAFVNEMEKVAENNQYQLYLHKRLAAVALFDKKQNNYYFSNPYDVETKGSSVETTKNRQRSQIVLTYYDDENNGVELNSFVDCVSKQQFKIKKIDRGAEVQMMLGDAGEQYLLPEIMSLELFEKLLSKIAEDEKETLEDAYDRLTIKDSDEDVIATLLGEYPYLKKGDLYRLDSLPTRTKESLHAALEATGLTREEITAEYEKVEFEADDKLPAFALTVRYELDKDGLQVSIPMESVSYQSKYYQIDKISILPYFGSGQISDTDGELLIPDGSGAIMKYNTDLSKRLTNLSMGIYGQDATSVSDNSEKTTTKEIRMPVFGNKSKQGSYLAIIEEGESISTINVSSGDGTDPYPNAYVSAQYRYNEVFFYNDKDFSKNVMAYADTYNKGDVSIKYIPLKGNSNYVDMAFTYKNYLIQKGALTKQNITPQLILQMLGYCNNNDGTFSLTTFEDATAILKELKEQNVTNMSMRYLGWTSGGLNNYYVDKFTLDSVMGGKKNWKQLEEFAAKQNVTLFMDADLSYVRRTKMFDNFSTGADSCRNIRNLLCGIYEYNYGDSDINKAVLFNGVASQKMLNDVNGLYDSFRSQMGKAKISVGTLGSQLNSNFKSGQIVTRPEAQKQVAQVLEKLSSNGGVMLENANVFTLPYCDYVINLDMTSSSFDSTDYDVPFYQLVVNGCVAYSAKPLNESENTKTSLLKAFETGADISYIVAYRNQDQLKNSTKSDYYSVQYDVIKKELTKTYKEYQAGMAKLKGATIADHEILAENVYLTTYSNGAKVVVNYSEKAYSFKNHKVAPEGYLILEGRN